MQMNLSDPLSNIKAFTKVRASLIPEDVITWFSGNIYGYVPGAGHKHLFQFEGHNVARCIEVEGGYQMLTREAVFYKDAVTGEILEEWLNPYTGETNQVLHVWNDPVNGGFLLDGPRGKWSLVPEISGDAVNFSTDVFLMYPNPLDPAVYKREVNSNVYQGAELFRFIASKADIEDDSPSAPCHISWVRMAPYVPWMLMGDRPGNMVYHTGGRKLMGGYPELPAHLRAYIEANRPEYAFAPQEMVTPNDTSWTVYAKERGPSA
jgi:Protein of unknown function (DUF1838)